jgi:hypothetical protein
MSEGQFVLSREQRDEINRAVNAIQRRLKQMAHSPRSLALYVIANNLTVIQTNVANLPRVSPN